MTIEIQKPELQALILQRLNSGDFRDIEDVLMQALQASPMIDAKQQQTREQRTGADLIDALQASPYRELEIEPARFRLSMPLRDVTL